MQSPLNPKPNSRSRHLPVVLPAATTLVPFNQGRRWGCCCCHSRLPFSFCFSEDTPQPCPSPSQLEWLFSCGAPVATISNYAAFFLPAKLRGHREHRLPPSFFSYFR
ncbi:unnamed protein product [Lactuca virosa]|uniref:Uncharacterized protein n=1 Tax=Lactuca virosa TaxID=75947 RepID=A0AAU9NE45_9ASTR|nr:unnamed protein product [Lactuca virosa]